MAQQTINIGAAPNDGTGDPLRDAFDKANDNFTELYALVAASGGRWKDPVRVASTANVTLASAVENGDTIDGVTLATGDRVLLKDQSTASENGIYVVAASGAPTRATDADAGAELVNAAVLVSEGTANADKLFVCTTNAPITVGSTGLSWANPFGGLGGGDLLAANNLSDVASAATALANLLAPLSLAHGDILYRGSSGLAKLAAGTSGQFLKTLGSGANPSWAAPSSAAPWDFSPPTAASFSLQSSDATNLTLSDDANLGLIVDAGALASNPWRYAYRTLTTPASAWDMIVKFPFFASNQNFGGGGIFAHNSTSGRLMQLYAQNTAPVTVSKFSGLGSYSSDVANPSTFAGQVIQWFRIASNGTTISFHVGFGPNCWSQIFSESLATYLNSSGSTNRVGFFYRVNANWKTIGHIPYFSLTGPGV